LYLHSEEIKATLLKLKICLPPRHKVKEAVSQSPLAPESKRKRSDRSSDSERTPKRPQVPPRKEITPSRKHCSDDDGDQVSSEPPLRKRRGRPRKKQPSDDHRAKQRGRPRKAIEDPQSRQFLVPVFVEMAVAPKLVRGRTPRGDKFVKQPPSTEGPFSLTQGIDWDAFVTEIARVVRLDKENLVVSTMTWSFQRKAVLPLTNEGGYKTMIQQIRVLKDPSSAIIVVSLPMPQTKASRSHNVNDSELSAMGHEDNSLWGKKVRASGSSCLMIWI
jgi:hypothetical protein